jgi:hypothetical protein
MTNSTVVELVQVLGADNAGVDWDLAAADHDRQPWNPPHDPIAMSWAAYRTNISGEGGLITDEDRANARATREHFRNKIMLKMLRSQPLSEFQRDLYGILTGAPIQHRHRGMIYRLPHFYVEDRDRALLWEEIQSVPYNAGIDVVGKKLPMTLRPLRRIQCSRRRYEMTEYWFRDTASQTPVQWSVESKNSLHSMVKSLWDRGRDIPILAYYYIRQRRDQHRFITLNQPELVLA